MSLSDADQAQTLAMRGTEILPKSLEILLQNLPESLPAEDSPDFQNIYDDLLPGNWEIDSNVLNKDEW